MNADDFIASFLPRRRCDRNSFFPLRDCLQELTDEQICRMKFDLAVSQSLAAKPINDMIVEIGRSFIGVDYRRHTRWKMTVPKTARGEPARAGLRDLLRELRHPRPLHQV
jgi:hypothetical protein